MTTSNNSISCCLKSGGTKWLLHALQSVGQQLSLCRLNGISTKFINGEVTTYDIHELSSNRDETPHKHLACSRFHYAATHGCTCQLC